MAQKVRVFSVLADYLDLVPSVQGGVQPPENSVPVNKTSSDLCCV